MAALTEQQVAGLALTVLIGVTATVASQALTSKAVEVLELEEPGPVVTTVATVAALGFLTLVAASTSTPSRSA